MSWPASRTFCAFFPIASESWSSGTTARTIRGSPMKLTANTRAGLSARLTKMSGSELSATISMRSPPSAFTMFWTREPFTPTQAPTGSTRSSCDTTAILVRAPGSRAMPLISTIRS